MPTPKPNESEDDYMQRCMAYPDMQKYEPSQRAAICHSKFRETKETEPKILDLLEPKKSAAESIYQINNDITKLKESISKLQETTRILGLEFEGLNAIQILAGIEQQFNQFTNKYGVILDTLAKNTQAEAKLIAKIDAAIDGLKG